MALGYTITVLRIEHIKNGIRDSGISIVKELAKHIRVELLENDAPAIRRQLIDTSKREGIVYLAVSDHFGKVNFQTIKKLSVIHQTSILPVPKLVKFTLRYHLPKRK